MPGCRRLRRCVSNVPATGEPIQRFRNVRGGVRVAENELNRFIAELERGRASTSAVPRQTVGELLDAWLEFVAPQRSPTSVRGYRDKVNRWKRAIGAVPVSKLTPRDLDLLYARWLAEGLSPKMVRHLHPVLAVALRQAQRWGQVQRCVTDLVSPPAAVVREVGDLDPAAWQAVILDLREREPVTAMAVLWPASPVPAAGSCAACAAATSTGTGGCWSSPGRSTTTSTNTSSSWRRPRPAGCAACRSTPAPSSCSPPTASRPPRPWTTRGRSNPDTDTSPKKSNQGSQKAPSMAAARTMTPTSQALNDRPATCTAAGSTARGAAPSTLSPPGGPHADTGSLSWTSSPHPPPSHHRSRVAGADDSGSSYQPAGFNVSPLVFTQSARDCSNRRRQRRRRRLELPNRQVKALDQRIVAVFRKHPDAAIFASSPAVGPVTAAALLAEVKIATGSPPSKHYWPS